MWLGGLSGDWIVYEWKHKGWWDSPGGPVVENLPFNAGDEGWIPGWRTEILHAVESLSPCAETIETAGYN